MLPGSSLESTALSIVQSAELQVVEGQCGCSCFSLARL